MLQWTAQWTAWRTARLASSGTCCWTSSITQAASFCVDSRHVVPWCVPWCGEGKVVALVWCLVVLVVGPQVLKNFPPGDDCHEGHEFAENVSKSHLLPQKRNPSSFRGEKLSSNSLKIFFNTACCGDFFGDITTSGRKKNNHKKSVQSVKLGWLPREVVAHKGDLFCCG